VRDDGGRQARGLESQGSRSDGGKADLSVRVFLVEDMKQVQGVLADLLASLGDFRLVGATRTEAEAKLWLQENPGAWDLAIIDLVLDQGTGMAVIPRARAAAGHEGGNIVVFSDYASDGIRKHCLKLGADAVFLKSQTQEFMDYCSELGGLAAATAS
jgi:DNA-binding NarL/FixJ family response regulator